MMNYEQLASQIITALTGTPAPVPVYSNGMMNQGYPQQGNMMNQGYQQQGGMMNQNTPQQASGDTWVCACGATNTGTFCEYCGSPKP